LGSCRAKVFRFLPGSRPDPILTGSFMPPRRLSSQFGTGFVPLPSRFRSRASVESLRKMPAVKSTLIGVTDILPVSTAHKSVAVRARDLWRSMQSSRPHPLFECWTDHIVGGRLPCWVKAMPFNPAGSQSGKFTLSKTSSGQPRFKSVRKRSGPCFLGVCHLAWALPLVMSDKLIDGISSKVA